MAVWKMLYITDTVHQYCSKNTVLKH